MSTSKETVYRGHHDQTAPVSEEYSVTVNGEPSPSDTTSCRHHPAATRGPPGVRTRSVTIAILAHAYEAEFAWEYYRQFKREVVSELPEEGWTLTKRDLDVWRREVVGDA